MPHIFTFSHLVISILAEMETSHSLPQPQSVPHVQIWLLPKTNTWLHWKNGDKLKSMVSKVRCICVCVCVVKLHPLTGITPRIHTAVKVAVFWFSLPQKRREMFIYRVASTVMAVCQSCIHISKLLVSLLQGIWNSCSLLTITGYLPQALELSWVTMLSLTSVPSLI